MKKEERIAEFIGVMLGDGCIGIYDCKAEDKIKKQYQLKVTLDSRNKQYINYVFYLMRDILELEPKINIKKNENTADIRTFRKEKVLYAINNLGLELSPKWKKAKIPDGYGKGKLALFVLRGLFDTDGSITIFKNNKILYPRIEIRLCPSPMQQQVLDILKENNIRYTIQRLERGKIKIRISGKEELRNWFKKIGSSNYLYLKRAERFLKINSKF